MSEASEHNFFKKSLILEKQTVRQKALKQLFKTKFIMIQIL